MKYEGELIQEIEEPEVVKKLKRYIFEDHEFIVRLMYKNIRVKDFFKLHTGYGLEGARKTAIKDAEGIVERWGIKPNENIKVVVVDVKFKIKKKKVHKTYDFENQYQSVGYQYDEKEEIIWNSQDLKKE